MNRIQKMWRKLHSNWRHCEESKYIERHRNELSELLQQPPRGIFADAGIRLAQFLGSERGTFGENAIRKAMYLGFIGHALARQGLVNARELFSGQSWDVMSVETRKEIELGVAYMLWEARVSFEDFQIPYTKHGSKVFIAHSSFDMSSLIYCYSIANEIEHWQDICTGILSFALERPDVQDAISWPKRNFEPFVWALIQLKKRKSLPEAMSGAQMGPYLDIFTFWNHPESLGDAIVGICDYHLDNMDEGRRATHEEFWKTPFTLIPYEIIALYKIRAELGLETPSVDHELLPAPPLEYPPRFYGVTDEYLTEVETQFKLWAKSPLS